MAGIKTVVDRLPFATTAAAIVALGCATLAALTPLDLIGDLMVRLSIAAVIPPAAPPLGLKAQAIVVALVGLLSFAVVRTLLAPLGRRLDAAPVPVSDFVEDASPAEPPVAAAPVASVSEQRRRPIFAADELGAPLMSDDALVRVAPAPDDEAPRDAAVPDVPLAVDPVLAVPLAVTEFALDDADEEPPVALPTARPYVGPAFVGTPTSLDDLVKRLEAGLARRDGTDPRGPGATWPTPRWLAAARAELGLDDASGDDMRAELRQALGQMRAIATR